MCNSGQWSRTVNNLCKRVRPEYLFGPPGIRRPEGLYRNVFFEPLRFAPSTRGNTSIRWCAHATRWGCSCGWRIPQESNTRSGCSEARTTA